MAGGVAELHNSMLRRASAALPSPVQRVVALLAPPLAFARDALLKSYAQIIFSSSGVVGLFLLAATAVAPRLALGGALAVSLALAAAWLLNLSSDQARSGLLAYNALLVGIGGSAMLAPSPGAYGLIALAVVATVLLTAALHSAMGVTFNLPVLTLPFLLVFTMVLAAAPSLGLEVRWLVVGGGWLPTVLPARLELLLQSLGAVFFLPRADAGLLVLLAMLVHSRVATLLALLGFAVSQAVGASMVGETHALMPVVLAYSFQLTSIALGGTWFVPGPASFVLAGTGSLICGLITLGTVPDLAAPTLPQLLLPFNLTVILLLYAMRQRVRDRSPKAVDFLLGTPEENLNYYRTRLSRFGARYFVRFGAPFMGRWTCTQGVDGPLTHKGPWRHALDFQVTGEDGRTSRGTGRSLADYHCYKLPVLAPADGTVAKVVDDIPDNKIGEVNLKDNWGNLVLLYHAPGLYSMACHFSPGSLKVQQGQPVRRGDMLGLCGSSGRSPEPHLHWQLQATARVGAPTLEVELHDVVREGDTPRLMGTYTPREGDVVRNLKPDDNVARDLRLTYGEALRFTVNGVEMPREETVVPDIDLYGNLQLRSEEQRAILHYNTGDDLFTVFDTIGRRRSVLHIMHAALARVPFEVEATLRWEDHLPLRHFLAWPGRLALDIVSPFTRNTGIRMTYRARRQGQQLVINGTSTRRHKGGQPLVQTEATLTHGLGIEDLKLTVRGRTHHAIRISEKE